MALKSAAGLAYREALPDGLAAILGQLGRGVDDAVIDEYWKPALPRAEGIPGRWTG
jgi:hypothetical protein